MAELRFNPLLQDFTIVASHRQDRPQMPADWCPFCPGSGRVPASYDVHAYDNDFPALFPDPPEPDPVATPLYKTMPAFGKCEVILYSPDHTASMSRLPTSHIRKVVDLWVQRTAALGADPAHKYVYIFENRGPEVGVTMPHPHGQIYAFPYVPQKIRVELDSCRKHHDTTGRCLLCDITDEEMRDGRRMVVQTAHFVSYIPFFTDYPYGVFISSRRHLGSFVEFTDGEKDDLALHLKRLTTAFDALFARDFPYMMVIHQTPVNGEDEGRHYHFHIEFYPPLRSATKIKYLASAETGAWAPCNPAAVEQTAAELRDALARAGDIEDGQGAVR